MNGEDVDGGTGCCGREADACAFDKALLAHSACCALARRRSVAEGEQLACNSPVALANCTTLVALLRERSTFALRLPRGPLMHAQALKLQCGGVQGIRNALQTADDDVHRLVGQAEQRWGSLTDLPWDAVVRDVVAWPPRRRAGPAR